MSLSLAVKECALAIGFDLAGIAPIAAWRDLEFSRQWVERGYGGEMQYLQNPQRDDPRTIMPGAQSVICVGQVYNAPLPYSTEVASQPLTPGPSPQGRGWPREAGTSEGSRPRAWISRYAWGRDYHAVMRAKLEQLRAAIKALAPSAATRVYVDTGPVVERAFARLSGIGWTGKNTCLINQQKGSWFFLGVVLTSLPLEPDLPAPDRCGSCNRCIEACPTDALVEPYVMNASRCIAYLNIELKGSIPEEFRSAIGANVFGCDICQDVCPWNNRPLSIVSGPSSVVGRQFPAGEESPDCSDFVQRSTRPGTTARPEFQPLDIELKPEDGNPLQRTMDHGQLTEDRVSNFEFRFSTFNPPLEALASMTEGDFRRAFRDSPIKRVKYRGWLRNLCVAMGNSNNARFVPKLRELAAHPDPIVREHALWALRRLAGLTATDTS